MVLKPTNNGQDPKDQESAGPSKVAAFLQSIRLDPVSLVSDSWDTLDMWRATRNWRPIMTIIPAFLLVFAVFGTIVWGGFTSKSGIVGRYVDKAEEVAPIKQDGKEKSESRSLLAKGVESGDEEPKEDSAKSEEERLAEEIKKNDEAQFADLLFRRVLQVDDNNKRARYYVANQMSLRGNRDQARTMMQSMAPNDVKGYEPAHAWLAGELLQQFAARKSIDKTTLNHHLSIASDWPGTNPSILSAYSQLLESEKRTREAIGMMQRAANRDSAYYLQLAGLFARYNQPVQAKEAVDRTIQHYSASFGKKDEPDSDRVAVAEAYLQIQKLEEAAKVLQQGLSLRPDRPALRRALSNVYRLAYRQQLKRSEAGVQANLNLLNAALAADPTNPALGEEVALLQPLGVKPDELMIQSLQKQLAAGGASAVTHVLLGNAFYNRKDLNKAVIHWELALGQDPNMVLAINNLALAMAYKEEPNFERAMTLADRALEIGKENPEFLDTKGEILALMGNHVEAIPYFEKAIRLGPYRVSSREKLAMSYEKAGLIDQSKAQWELLEELKAKIQKNKEEAARVQAAQKEAEAALAAEAEAAAAANAVAEAETAAKAEMEKKAESENVEPINPASEPANQPEPK